ncbi:MAG: ABC transporter ATP-binding protein [Planctomycetes bacterium]|nr:ABC transporter ATP-binding protein [Planctomycetota bacterium]
MRTYGFVLPYARRYWHLYLAGLLLVPVSAASSLAVPYLTGECVKLLEATGEGARSLGELLAWIAAAAVASGLSLFAVRYLIIGASRHVEFDLRNRIFQHLHELDLSFYNEARTGDLMSRISTDVDRVRLLVGPVIMYSSRWLLMLAVGLPLMIAVSLPLTLLVMVPLSLITFAVRSIGPRVHREIFKAQEALADLSSLAQEDFSGIRVVKSFAQEDAEERRFADIARRYLQRNMGAVRISSWMLPVISAVSDLALISLLLVGGMLMLRSRIDYGDFVKFAGYQLALIWPMLSIGWVVNQYHRAGASVDRIRELLEARPRVTEPDRPVLPASGRIEGDLSIRGLSFGYGEHLILRDVSLDAPRGSTVAIVGRTGAGKTTVLNMIPRLLPTPEGTVFIDGVDVTRIPLETLRRSIGYVDQESFLFSRTVEENIAFGVDAVERERVLAASHLARFDKDIDQFPGGWEEMVGERGVTLSGGQKQRAALARALFVRPRILILDDAFSAVDTQTEEQILDGLREATRDLTVLIVSHRVSSVAHADRIYVLDEGRVAEEGTHEKLLHRGGIYAEIHRLQQLSDELDRY